jgi:ATP-dependent DNA helicase RecG
VYQSTGQKVAYIRQAGFDPIKQEHMVFSYLESHDEIRRRDVIELCQISKDQAARLLKKLATDNKIFKHGIRKGAFYKLTHNL